MIIMTLIGSCDLRVLILSLPYEHTCEVSTEKVLIIDGVHFCAQDFLMSLQYVISDI